MHRTGSPSLPSPRRSSVSITWITLAGIASPFGNQLVKFRVTLSVPRNGLLQRRVALHQTSPSTASGEYQPDQSRSRRLQLKPKAVVVGEKDELRQGVGIAGREMLHRDRDRQDGVVPPLDSAQW